MDGYREFISEQQAREWGEKSFPQLTTKEFKKTEEFKALFFYGGNMYKPVNKVLRGIKKGDDEICLLIDTINSIVQNNFTPENIAVYRCVNKEDINRLCGLRVRKGIVFSDKAFLSTSLSKECAMAFYKKYHKNCLLKLYLPKGVKGAYLSYSDTVSVLHEQEFLLAPNIEFEIIKVHHFTIQSLDKQ